MIDILIGNEALDPPVGGWDLQFTDDISLFSFVRIDGEHTWDFEIPKTPKNIRLCLFANVLEATSSRVLDLQVSLIMASKLWKVGLLYFDDDEEKFFKAHFVGGNGILHKQMENLLLKDLDWPDLSYTGAPKDHFKTVCQQGHTQHDFTLMSYAMSPGNVVNYYDVITQAFRQEPTFPFYCAPHIYVKAILRKLGEHLGFSIESLFLEEEEMQRLILFTNKLINERSGTGYTTTIPNPYNIAVVLGDLKAIDFLNAFAKFWNLFIDYKPITAQLQINQRSQLLNSNEVIDWSRQFLSIKPAYNKNVVNYLNYEVGQEAKTFLYTADLLDNREHNPNDEPIDVKAGSFFSENTSDGLAAVLSGDLETELPIYFAFDRGFNNGGNPSWPLRPRATTIPFPGDNYSTLWRGDGNYYDLFWDKFLDKFNRMKAARATLKLTPADILSYDPKRFYTDGKYKVLFRNLEYSISNNQITDAKADVYVF